MEETAAYLIHLILLFLCLPMSSIALQTNNITTDQSALLVLKSRFLNSSNVLMKNWTTEIPICNWIGVKCSSGNQRVVALNISYVGLEGSIPPEIGNLTFLNSMDIRSNKFTGSLPEEMVHLQSIKYIDLSLNNFSGEIPSWFGSLRNLQFLRMNSNGFTGTLPLSLFNASKLEALHVARNKLQGNIPQEIANLGILKILNMEFNELTGSIPSTIRNMSSLEIIALTDNRLSGNLPLNICSKLPKLQLFYASANGLADQIDSRFDNCSELQVLSLSFNNFSGTISRMIGNLTALRELHLGRNLITGEIPAEIGNLLDLEVLGIEEAAITGSVPKEIGDLQKLYRLGLHSNFLNGVIPATIFNISSLTYISLTHNNLSGSLPPDIGHTLRNLEVLYFRENKLSGVIPESILNCTELVILELGNNQLTGSIPASLGSLIFLEFFNVELNHLTSGSSPELNFLSSLVNCRNLRVLTMSHNPINGTLPSIIGNFSNTLEKFDASFCGLEGTIPHEIGNLSGLPDLNLGGNYLTGQIPMTFQGLLKVQKLDLQGNSISGSIPNYFCNFRDLSTLHLAENQLLGQVPDCFGNLTSLRQLYLHSNKLNSSLPASLGNLKDLLNLDVHSNSFSGNIPAEIGNLKAALSMDLSENKFSGNIPTTIGDLQNLVNLSLANNELQGPIPQTFGKQLSLELLDLSSNNLSGEIPTSLELLLHLKYFNVSFNRLRGKIPENGSFLNFTKESFVSNEALCGGAPGLHFPPCAVDSPRGSRKKRLLLVAYILIPTALTVISVSILFVFMKKREKTRSLAQIDVVPAFMHRRVSYYELRQGTKGFSESNLLARGGYGNVYEGVLKDGTVVAIKVFNVQLEEAFKSFDRECEILGSLRHRNLVKIISSCSNPEFKALILAYMPNGSLEKQLYSPSNFLDFLQRLDIMIDVASALVYLHHEYSFPLVHCDLKPSNILLDKDMIGHVSDFGISKLFGEGESMAQTRTFATIGYIAPEYGFEGIVSTKSDVYSFGIVLMETFSRKKPTDEMFTEEWRLKDWIIESLQNSESDFIDQNLMIPEDRHSTKKVQCVFSIMKLALKCTLESPEQRVDARDALEMLKKIKILFLSS